MIIPSFYILTSDGEVTTTDDQQFWLEWYSKIENRRVAKTVIEDRGEVSTVFISTISCIPAQWETMYTPIVGENQHWRWYSLAEAQAGHELVLDYVREDQ